ncbi:MULTISPECIES: aminopeptidase C [unclassified Romboutsia]|uniref:aminopeptidase C n=1 Tax=unclassified Romboutsia TaxID=2626894 RepID=UPI0008215860|nr:MULTISPECIES: C1 family peptidase [unclassified Romboutsia]SCI41586.1 Aminopeptidase C [uncultured Clostridium sp.]
MTFKSINTKILDELEYMFDKETQNIIAMNMVNKSGVSAAIRDYDLKRRMQYTFSIDIESGEITNQKRAGLCWVFAALNTMRLDVMKNLNLDNMELSQSYILFYDKLEKSNYFLESILETLREPTDSRLISFLLSAPLNDGGQWDMLANLVRKYGVVPKDVMPDTFVSTSTDEINPWLTKKLREFACQIRKSYNLGESIEELRAKKKDMMATIYRMLCISIGKPPKKFTWEVKDKENTFIRIKNITPNQFFEDYVDWNLDDYVSIINAPTNDKPFNHSYTIKFLGNVKEGNIIRHLNLPVQDLKKLAINQLKDGNVVWFGCDVGQFLDKEYGSMDIDGVQANKLFKTEFAMNKAERLDYGESLMTHAMVFTGVDLERYDEPIKWKVENSWGNDSGNKGFYIMSDKWFSEYVYQIVINKKYLTKELIDQYESDPIVLQPWDPMGSLA